MDDLVIFQMFPELERTSLGCLLEISRRGSHPLEKAGEELDADLWIKRDDESGK